MDIERRHFLMGAGALALVPSISCGQRKPVTSAPTLRMRDLGVAGDGRTDATAALQHALSSNAIVDGGGGRFAVRGPVVFGPGFKGLVNATIVQQSPVGDSLRTLHMRGATNFVIENVHVIRGGNGGEVTDIKYIGNTGGIFLVQCSDFRVRGLDVSGGGIGSGAAFVRSSTFTLDDVHAHDMMYHLPEHPRDDAIDAILFTKSDKFTATNLQSSNIGGTDGRTSTNNNNRGIGVSGCSHYKLLSPRVQNVGQGIDNTGGNGNTNFTIENALVQDCYSWGIKCADSAQDAVISSSVARRCGMGGFVASGPHSDIPWRPERIVYRNCSAEEVLGHRPGHSFGFGINRSRIDPHYPRDVTFEHCTATTRDPGNRMMFGFLNLVANDPAHPNQCIDCHASGYRAAATSGFS